MGFTGDLIKSISILAPARGATPLPFRQRFPTRYFNSRPCERGDLKLGDNIIHNEGISILAPARGATRPLSGHGCEYSISILAPARGATM